MPHLKCRRLEDLGGVVRTAYNAVSYRNRTGVVGPHFVAVTRDSIEIIESVATSDRERRHVRASNIQHRCDRIYSTG